MQRTTPQAERPRDERSPELRVFDIPLDNNFATISFNKLPLSENDLDDIKSWIDLFGKKLIKKGSSEIPLQEINEDKI